MDRKITAAVVAGGAAVGMAAGYAAPLLAASEGRDAPSPGPFNTYTHGSTDGWHYYPNGGFWNSDQNYTYTQTVNGQVNWDEAYWKFDRHGTYTSVQFWDTSSGIMNDYVQYSTFAKANGCVNQGAYSNVMVTVLTNGYVDGEVQMAEPACVASGAPVGADAVVVNW